jgi:hypothetical protein
LARHFWQKAIVLTKDDNARPKGEPSQKQKELHSKKFEFVLQFKVSSLKKTKRLLKALKASWRATVEIFGPLLLEKHTQY